MNSTTRTSSGQRSKRVAVNCTGTPSRKVGKDSGERQGDDESSISFQEPRLHHKFDLGVVKSYESDP
jgi:hypothetical protein